MALNITKPDNRNQKQWFCLSGLVFWQEPTNQHLLKHHQAMLNMDEAIPYMATSAVMAKITSRAGLS